MVSAGGSVVTVDGGLSCSEACRIFQDPESNLCPLHWQADSQPLDLQGSPRGFYVTNLAAKSDLNCLETFVVFS